VSFRLTVDAESVIAAAGAVRAVGAGLDAAPGGAALLQVAAALPGSELARVAGTEAAEWSREMTDVAAVFERYTALLEAMVAVMGRTDTAGAAAYGSLTTGIALQRGTGVDDVVFFGSPGIGTNDVRDLGLRSGHVFVVEARNDPVADLATFGTDPNHLAGVTGLSAARAILDGVERAESPGHSEYLTDQTTSQYGIAAVLAGVPRQAPLDGGSGAGDVLRRVGPLLVPGGR